MKILTCAGAILLMALVVTGCGQITRTEKDTYTITRIDTTRTEAVRNSPGERDNGIIYPSSRTLVQSRSLVQYDSVEERDYPAFIRLGLFEGIGMIGSSQGGSAVGLGMFGVHYDVDRLLRGTLGQPTSEPLFDGAMYRIGIGEWRLRWFDDAPGWSWGVTGAEIIRPDNDSKNWLTGAGVLTLSKRWYLRPDIPYASIRISGSFGIIPSQYFTLTTSADLGSIGGLNLRAYAGYTAGLGGLVSAGSFSSIPFVGFGASVLDFLNREDELYTEWKDHPHSAWEISISEVAFIGSQDERSVFAPRLVQESVGVRGLLVRLASASVALPVLDYRLTFGTSLFSMIATGATSFGFAMLPLRLSYVLHPGNGEIQLEPFLEYGYAPSTVTNLGLRLALPVANQVSLTVYAGYVTGQTGSDLGLDIEGVRRTINNPTAFNSFYLGVGTAIFDHLFKRSQLRYAAQQ